MDAEVTDQSTLVGEPGGVYDVTVRVRGVVEMSAYMGGMFDGPIYVGGSVDSYWLPYGLTVSDPPQTYWLNPQGDGDLFTHGIDYTYTLPVVDGGELMLMAGPDNDGCSLFNHDPMGEPIVIPDVPPAPAAFDGQFIQIDIESIERVGR